jgi:hypothetical protein
VGLKKMGEIQVFRVICLIRMLTVIVCGIRLFTLPTIHFSKTIVWLGVFTFTEFCFCLITCTMLGWKVYLDRGEFTFTRFQSRDQLPTVEGETDRSTNNNSTPVQGKKLFCKHPILRIVQGNEGRIAFVFMIVTFSLAVIGLMFALSENKGLEATIAGIVMVGWIGLVCV